MTQKSQYNVAVIIPTRKRPAGLERAVKALYETAADPKNVLLMVAFDDDDVESQEAFANGLAEWMDDHEYPYIAQEFPRLGYGRLHDYTNALCKVGDADWFFNYNDDAIMETVGWDALVAAKTGEFKLLSAYTHNDHPYAIFPIFPREWFELFGYFALHQASDAWISQQAFLLDLYERINIRIDHQRADLVGGEQDETFQQRQTFEGNPSDPRDFHHPAMTKKRLDDCYVLADYMRSRGISTDWWEKVLRGEVHGLQKMSENDPNNQTCSFKIVNGQMVRV